MNVGSLVRTATPFDDEEAEYGVSGDRSRLQGARIHLRLGAEVPTDFESAIDRAVAECLGRGRFSRLTIHVDLASVTRLDADAIRRLNCAYIQTVAKGWSFHVNPPSSEDPHVAFVRAAIDRVLLWAAGSPQL